ncbi:Tyrosine recombinase XerC [subsurface metagenome]
MMPTKDIHDFNAKYEAVLKQLKKSTISDKNKDLVRDFDRACFLEGLSKPRRIRLIGSLVRLGENYLEKDFDRATEKDVKEAVMQIESREDCSVWTKHGYKTTLKKFYKWLEYGDNYKERNDYPKIVSWIRAHIKKKDKPRVQASDILTEKEVKKLISAAEHPRDKAFISMLYELGARIGEIGSLQIKDITRDKYSFIVDLNGKTGHRTPRIVMSDPYVTHWLNVHPTKDDPESPLWTMTGGRNKKERMKYAAFRALIQRLRTRAKIGKRLYPHLFRHSRVTHLLSERQISEAQAKVYFGWVPSSDMLSEYSHLVSSDVNNTILEIHGIKRTKEKESLLKPKQCQSCGAINSKDALFCQKCSKVLDVKTAIELDEKRKSSDDIITALVKNPKSLKKLAEILSELDLGKKLMEI